MHLILIDLDLGNLGMIGLHEVDPFIRNLLDQKGDNLIDDVFDMAERQIQFLGLGKGEETLQELVEPIDLFGDPVEVFPP